MTKRRRTTALERFVLATFALLIFSFVGAGIVLLHNGVVQLQEENKLSDFRGEVFLVDQLTEETVWGKEYKLQVGTLNGANGWIPVSEGGYYRAQTERFVCVDSMELLSECPENVRRWPEFMRRH